MFKVKSSSFLYNKHNTSETNGTTFVFSFSMLNFRHGVLDKLYHSEFHELGYMVSRVQGT